MERAAGQKTHSSGGREDFRLLLHVKRAGGLRQAHQGRCGIPIYRVEAGRLRLPERYFKMENRIRLRHAFLFLKSYHG